MNIIILASYVLYHCHYYCILFAHRESGTSATGYNVRRTTLIGNLNNYVILTNSYFSIVSLFSVEFCLRNQYYNNLEVRLLLANLIDGTRV